ncbi:MAG: thioredoxin family protein [Rhodocyclaceae bacterium]|nr:thioredoxin family protein [Rhodocyclaceae bacterium]
MTWRRLVWIVIGLVGAAWAWATQPAAAADGGRVTLWFFWAEGCPHCEAAHPFIAAIPRERPWVDLEMREVSRHRANAELFAALAASLGQRAEAVPTLIFCGQMEVGWESEETTGKRLLQRLDDCRAGRSAQADAVLELPLLGQIDPASQSLLVTTLVIAALDAFNPCAFFVLLFLLSLLAHQKERRRMLAVGALFVLVSGMMYFAFMAAWLNVFHWLGAFTGITAAAGLLAIVIGLINLKDGLAFKRGFSLSIPDSAKPALYRRARAIVAAGNVPAMLLATAVLAVAANFYELLCTAGFPMIYTRLLTLAEPSPQIRYLWLLLYNLVYVVPLSLIVLAFVGTLAVHKLSEREGRLLKFLSGMMMLELGLVLVLAPEWLNRLAATAALLAVALGATFVFAKLILGSKANSGG